LLVANLEFGSWNLESGLISGGRAIKPDSLEIAGENPSGKGGQTMDEVLSHTG
jgi:hypothetical protein